MISKRRITKTAVVPKAWAEAIMDGMDAVYCPPELARLFQEYCPNGFYLNSTVIEQVEDNTDKIKAIFNYAEL